MVKKEGWAVCWHSDDEPLLGGSGDSKISVSSSFGSSTSFKWRVKSCSDSVLSSCWLRHGDLLIMDGQVQDDFCALCGFSGLEQERIDVTLPLD